MTKVAVDAMGGDRAPEEVLAGALEAANDGIEPVLFGTRSASKPAGWSASSTSEVIGMEEKPAEAVRGEAGQLARGRLPRSRRGQG